MSSIRYAVDGRWELAVSLIGAAVVLDGLDGRSARMLNLTSKLGAQLDSLADFLSFGVAPAVLVYSGRCTTCAASAGRWRCCSPPAAPAPRPLQHRARACPTGRAGPTTSSPASRPRPRRARPDPLMLSFVSATAGRAPGA